MVYHLKLWAKLLQAAMLFISFCLSGAYLNCFVLLVLERNIGPLFWCFLFLVTISLFFLYIALSGVTRIEVDEIKGTLLVGYFDRTVETYSCTELVGSKRFISRGKYGSAVAYFIETVDGKQITFLENVFLNHRALIKAVESIAPNNASLKRKSWDFIKQTPRKRIILLVLFAGASALALSILRN